MSLFFVIFLSGHPNVMKMMFIGWKNLKENIEDNPYDYKIGIIVGMVRILLLFVPKIESIILEQ